ncbi:MAG: HypC/HybG/HupF family hydrogenase formation chaperone [Gammaproteobacteria bacterium]
MCIGIPMKIVGYQGDWAVCESEGRQRLIDMMLVGRQDVGTWVLVFLDTARETISEKHAGQIADALRAVGLAMQGETAIDDLFADLTDRTPELPAFLKQEAE